MTFWSAIAAWITRRAHAQSETRYRSLTELSNDFFWETDAEHRYTAIELGRAYRGVRNNETKLGFTRWDIPYASPDASAWAAHRAAIAARERFIDFRFSRIENGEERFYEHSGEPRYDARGKFLGYRGVGRDVTERLRAEEALRQSEGRYMRAVAAAEAGFWDWDVVQDKYYVSPRLLEMAGLPKDTIIAGREDFQARVPLHPEDLARWQQEIQALFASGGSRLSTELRVIVGGQTRWYRLDGMCFRDAAGRVVRWTGSSIDVTERKRVEEALRLSEERYARAMEATEAGHWEWDLVANEVFHSPRFRELYGVPLEEQFASRDEWKARQPVSPSERERQERALQAAIADPAKSYDIELSFELRPGEVRWLRSRGKVFRGEDGRPLRISGATTDITARKLAQEGLRRSEERYARAMQASNDGLWEWDPTSDAMYMSERARHLWGLAEGVEVRTRAELKGHGRFHPKDLLLIEQAIQAARSGSAEGFDIEYRVLDGAGETRWLRSRGKAFRDLEGRSTVITGALTDITERKRAQSALALSEERYARAMEGSDAGHWDWDLVTDEMFVSARAREMLALPAGALPERRAEIMDLVPMHPEDRAAMIAYVNAGIRSGIHERDYRVMPRPGEMRWLRSRGKVYKDSRGAAVRMTGSLADITERKLAADALRASEERYSLAMEASEEGYVDVNLDTDEFVTSERLNEIFGIAPGTRFKGRSDFLSHFRFHDGDGETYRQAIRAIEADGGPDRYQFEFRIVLPSGEVRWVGTRGKVTRDPEGRARRRMGVFADITPRKCAEEALRRSEQSYALAMQAAQDAHWDWDMLTDEYYMSPRSAQLYGLPEVTEYPSRAHFLAISPFLPEDRRAWERATAELFAGSGERLSMELRANVRGELRWIQVNGLCVRDRAGKPIRWCGSSRDVTDRKRADAALRASEERYSLAMEAAEEGHFDWDVRTDEIFVSAHIRKVLDLPLETAFSTRSDLVSRIRYHPDDRAKLAEMARKVLASDVARHEFEYRILREIDVRWMRARWKIFRDAAGAAQRVIGVVTDITERKRAAEEVRDSEARFRALTELSSDWYWRQDENLRFTYVSHQINDSSKYPRQWVIGKTRRELPGVTPLSCSWEEHDALLEARQPFREFEYTRVGKDGGTEYVSVSGAPILDERGTFRGYQGVGSNITERKRAEDELRESEARFRALTELSSDWYWRQDEDLRFSYLSDQVEDLTGSSGESSLGKTRWEIADMTPLSCSWPEHQAVLAARQPFRDLECRRVGPNGTVRYLSMSGAPIFDAQGRFRGYQGVGRNITERKRIEEELRARQEMLDLAQKSAQAIAFEWRIGADGPDQNRWSPELAAMYGVAPGSYNGSFEQWKELVHPEDWPAVKEAISHAQRTGEVSAEYRVMHPDGSVHWLLAKGRMFFDAEGKAARMVGFMHDVTERRRAEEEVKRMERQLRQAHRLEAMGTLAGGIAHDFNNILGAILGYGEMAMRDAPKGSRLRRDLDSIMTAGERGRALVDRVLAFSRSAVGERVPVHVEKVVREALDLVTAQLPPDVTLHAKLHAGAAAMLGDATQVHQVLMNLASNAIHAMPAGGTLRVSLNCARPAARAATIGNVGAADYVVLSVSDTGSGIAAEILERIFDPFFTTKEVGTGTGLGLSLVHGIVAELGGAIDVASKPGAGSTFTVYLPRSGDAADSAQDQELALPRGEGQRVLVVDDEEMLVRLATRTLQELGYAPVGFTSSAAALAAFRADPQRFDALITDERMPGISGSALIREVRGIRDRIPIVLMSGFVGGALASRAREAGAEEVLKKPLSARDLAASLARVLHP